MVNSCCTVWPGTQARIDVTNKLQHYLNEANLAIAQGVVMSNLKYGVPVFAETRISEKYPEMGQFHKIQVALNDLIRLKG